MSQEFIPRRAQSPEPPGEIAPPERLETPIPEVVAEDPGPDLSMTTRYAQSVEGWNLLLDYILEVEIPDVNKHVFMRYKPVLGRILALANIKREEVPIFEKRIDLIISWFKVKVTTAALRHIILMTARLMLTRSVDGFQTKQLSTSRKEHSLEGFRRQQDEQKKRSRWAFWKGRK